jgi:hypothetical protein
MAEEMSPEAGIEALRSEFPPSKPPAPTPKRATTTGARRTPIIRRLPSVRATRTTRGAGTSQAAALERLNAAVEDLIKENRKLKRQVDRLASRTTTATRAGIDRGLRSIQRRLQKALSGVPTRGIRRVPNRTAAISPRRRRSPASTP